MNKPIVKYIKTEFTSISVGLPAIVHPVNHKSKSVSNKQHAMTSPVQSYNRDTGVFETMNTMYVPTDDSSSL